MPSEDAWECDHHPEWADDQNRCHHPSHSECDYPGCTKSGSVLVANDAPLTSPEYAERCVCRWHQSNAFPEGA